MKPFGFKQSFAGFGGSSIMPWSTKAKKSLDEKSTDNGGIHNEDLSQTSALPNMHKDSLNFFSWLCIVPFSVNFDGNRYYQKPVSKIAQLVTLLLHFMSCLRVLLFTNGDLVIAEASIAGKVQRFNTFSWFLHLLNLYYTLWRGQPKFLLIFNQSRGILREMAQLGMKLPSRRTVKLITYFLTTTAVLFGLLETVFVDHALQSQSLTQAFSSRMESYQKSSSFGYNIVGFSGLGADAWTTALIVAQFFATLTSYFSCQLISCSAILLYMLTKSVTNRLKYGDQNRPLISHECSCILTLCSHLFDLADSIEEAIGSIVFSRCVLLVVGYSYQFKEVIFDTPGLRFHVLMSSTALVVCFLISADANAMMNKIVEWVRITSFGGKVNENSRFPSISSLSTSNTRTVAKVEEELLSQPFDPNKLNIFLSQIGSNAFGLKSGFFTITYGFLGNILGVIITYAAIMLQFKK